MPPQPCSGCPGLQAEQPGWNLGRSGCSAVLGTLPSRQVLRQSLTYFLRQHGHASAGFLLYHIQMSSYKPAGMAMAPSLQGPLPRLWPGSLPSFPYPSPKNSRHISAKRRIY